MGGGGGGGAGEEEKRGETDRQTFSRQTARQTETKAETERLRQKWLQRDRDRQTEDGGTRRHRKSRVVCTCSNTHFSFER